MSGGHYPYPKHIWTPTGGWWFTPKNFKTNNAIFAGVLLAGTFVSYKLSNAYSYDPQFEHDEETIKKWNDAVKK